jgi:putative hydrolase of the HAD superfamily
VLPLRQARLLIDACDVLVCFDLGRVLVRICGSLEEACRAAGLSTAIAVPDREAQKAFSAHLFAFERGELATHAFVAELTTHLGRPAHEAAATLDAWLLGVYPGAVALLDELAAQGHATACLSNTNARHWELMSAWQDDARLFSRLGRRYASHELGLRKPDAAIYAEVERRSGVAPAEILFFDDLEDNIAAARARGWQAVLVRSREDPVAEMRAALDQLLPRA